MHKNYNKRNRNCFFLNLLSKNLYIYCIYIITLLVCYVDKYIKKLYLINNYYYLFMESFRFFEILSCGEFSY